MPATRARSSQQRPARRLTAMALILVMSACGRTAGAPSTAPSSIASVADEAAWRTLAAPRTTPVLGAVRISVSEIQLGEQNPWGLETSLGTAIGLAELVAAGLLRRPDVEFVERRRFTAAVDAERLGRTRAAGAPPAGVSPGPEFLLSVTWAAFGATPAYLESRLLDPASGRIERSWRTETPLDADPVGVARAIVGGLIAELARMGRASAWADPIASAAPAAFERTDISVAAVNAFLEGLASEEVWNWEGARVGYQTASVRNPGFFEAEVALARAARLRLGGTLASG